MSTIESVKSVTPLAGSASVYQVTYADGSLSFVPLNTQNRDYANVLAWVAAGGVID